MAETPTPRTDAAEFDRDEDCSIPDDMIVTAVFSRQLETDLQHLARVAGEALKAAEKAIQDLAYTGTERIRDLVGEVDSAEKTAEITINRAGISKALSEITRIQNQTT